jgi:hypothetical protein
VRVTLLFGGLLLGGLSGAREATAQLYDGTNSAYNRRVKPLMRPFYETPSAQPAPGTTQVVLPQFPLQPEPDTATQNLFARHRVRSVLRLRLDENGQVQDTVGYQEVDRQGRWLVRASGTPEARTRRQWSYNERGQCLTILDSPSPLRPFRTRYNYNPEQRQGVQQALLADGSHVNLGEVQIYQHADTILTQLAVHAVRIQGRPYGLDLLTRTFTYAPHPDTLLTLSYHYDPRGRPVFSQALYRLHRQGRLREEGELDLRKAAKLLPAGTRADGSPMLLALRQQLRGGQDRQVRNQYYYDGRGRLSRHEQTVPGRRGTTKLTTRRFTYNSLNQLIGREETTEHDFSVSSTVYEVFSYSPEGLIVGETNNARSTAPTFYRYQYQFYE